MVADLLIDIETFASVDLRAVPVYRYVQDPRFEILMAAWRYTDWDENDDTCLTIGEDAVADIPGLWDPEVRKVAHNANFERVCFSELARRQFGGLDPNWFIDPDQYHDTQAAAAELGYPRKLEYLGPALGVTPKDAAGTALINWFCKPDRNGNRRMPEDHPEKWAAFCAYCVQDVDTMAEAHEILGELPPGERAVWLADQRINDRGLPVDRRLARAGVAAAEANRVEQMSELQELTGVNNPNSQPQMMTWVRSEDLPLPNLKAETIDNLLLVGEVTPDQRRALELKQELALVASKKFGAALASVSPDGRLRGGFDFFGAHTGRWAGRRVQPHNLPRASFTLTDPVTGKEHWDKWGERGAILDLIDLGAGASALNLKRLVRSMFVGPFAVVDYAAIEARVLAWLAGEEWALEAFRLGRDIYVETAERMGGLTRAQGKIAVLALGYNGGAVSLQNMAGGEVMHEGRVLTEDQIRNMYVYPWRHANPSIVGLWNTMHKTWVSGGPVGDFLNVEVDGKDRYIRLPSGRVIGYHQCRARWGTDRYGRRRLMLSFANPRKPGRLSTYGGRLIENVTQAVARDVLAEALVRLDAEGIEVVGHVHDEVIALTDQLKRMTELMCIVPEWATGMPLDAEGFITERYRKG